MEKRLMLIYIFSKGNKINPNNRILLFCYHQIIILWFLKKFEFFLIYNIKK